MNRIISLFVFLGITLISLAQDTLYYNKKSDLVLTKLEADFYNVIYRTDSSTKVLEYSKDDRLKTETNYSLYLDTIKVKDGLSKQYYETGELHVLENYKKDKLDGELKVYYKSGVLLRIENYNNGKFLDGKCFDELCNEIPFFERQTHPEFIGGVNAMYQFISENFTFSKKMIKNNMLGKVFVSFVVDKNGDIRDVKVARGIHPQIDNEAIYLIKSMPRWRPGTNDGIPVSCRCILPLQIKYK